MAVAPAVATFYFDQIGIVRGALRERVHRRSRESRRRRDNEGDRQGDRDSKKQFAHRRPIPHSNTRLRRTGKCGKTFVLTGFIADSQISHRRVSRRVIGRKGAWLWSRARWAARLLPAARLPEANPTGQRLARRGKEISERVEKFPGLAADQLRKTRWRFEN